MTLLKKDKLLTKLSEKTNKTKKEANEFLIALKELVIESVTADYEVALPELGKFTIIQRAARMGINPSTKERISIPAKNVVKFKISKSLKDIV